MYFFERGKKLFKSSEEVVSMFLGLAIVLVVIGLVFSFFQKRKGDITIPGVSNNLDISKVDINKNKQDTTINKSDNPSEYTVVKGDNLWKIAKTRLNNGDKWTEIAKANNLKNPRVLLVGQKLTIPAVSDNQVALKPTGQTIKPSDTTNTSTLNGSEYTIVKNDSLWKIAVKSYGDGYKWVKIRDANKSLMKNPGMIHVGNKIVLPELKS